MEKRRDSGLVTPLFLPPNFPFCTYADYLVLLVKVSEAGSVVINRLFYISMYNVGYYNPTFFCWAVLPCS